jgi:hypothetical protein
LASASALGRRHHTGGPNIGAELANGHLCAVDVNTRQTLHVLGLRDTRQGGENRHDPPWFPHG